MSSTLFKVNMKANWGIFVFVTGMLLIYIVVSVMMFDPDSGASIQAMLEFLPEGMLKAFGFDSLGVDLTSYLGGYLYGFIFIVFPLIYTIILSNSLVAKHVDRGSMVYLLTTPNSRVKVITTQVLYLVISTVCMFVVGIGILVALAESVHPGLLEIGPFLMLNLVTVMVIIVVASISFFFSCFFNDSRYALGGGAAVPIIFVVLKMVAEISEDLDVLRYFTIYTLIDPDKLLNDGGYAALLSLILLAVSGVIFSAGVYVFNKRSLTI